MRETVVTFTHYITDFFPIWIHTKPAILFWIHTIPHCPGRKAHLGQLELSPTGRSGLCWQGFNASFGSAFCPVPTAFYHLPPQFPTLKTAVEWLQPSLGRKTHGKELGMGSPGATPRCCLLTQTLKIWVGFLRDEASQHWCPVLWVTLDMHVLPPSSPACNGTRFFCSYCRIAEADEKLRCFNLDLVTAGMVPVQQMLADGIHYYYLLHSLK